MESRNHYVTKHYDDHTSILFVDGIQYFIEEELYEHEYCDAMIQLTSLLCEFIKPESKIGRERSKVVEDIYRLYQQYNAIDEVYRDILSAENMRAGMNYYIAQYKPELIQIASNLSVDAKEYLELLNSKLSNDSSYLWELGDTNRQIDNLYVDLKLISDINRVLTTKQKTYAETRKASMSSKRSGRYLRGMSDHCQCFLSQTNGKSGCQRY